MIVNPDKTTISTAYMDAAGVGKIISLSQAIFEGMENKTKEICELETGKLPGDASANQTKTAFQVFGMTVYLTHSEINQSINFNFIVHWKIILLTFT